MGRVNICAVSYLVNRQTLLSQSVFVALALALLSGCAGAAAETLTLEELNIPASLSAATEELPRIPMGSSLFEADDPATVQLASGQVQFVEFFAYWCSTCKAMAPAVHGLEDLYGGQVNFVYLDRDSPATEALRNQLGYIYQPHFFLLAPDGSLLGQWRGYVEGEVLQQAIVEAIQ